MNALENFIHFLSDYTHIQPTLQRGYLDFSGEYTTVIFRDYAAALKLSELHAQLVDLYVITSERISHEYFSETKAWTVGEDGSLSRRADYSCLTAMQRWLEGPRGGAYQFVQANAASRRSLTQVLTCSDG